MSDILEMFPEIVTSFRPIATAPRDGRVIEARSRSVGWKRLLIRWVSKSDYEGWDTGSAIQWEEWRPVVKQEIV